MEWDGKLGGYKEVGILLIIYVLFCTEFHILKLFLLKFVVGFYVLLYLFFFLTGTQYNSTRGKEHKYQKMYICIFLY